MQATVVLVCAGLPTAAFLLTRVKGSGENKGKRMARVRDRDKSSKDTVSRDRDTHKGTGMGMGRGTGRGRGLQGKGRPAHLRPNQARGQLERGGLRGAAPKQSWGLQCQPPALARAGALCGGSRCVNCVSYIRGAVCVCVMSFYVMGPVVQVCNKEGGGGSAVLHCKASTVVYTA